VDLLYEGETDNHSVNWTGLSCGRPCNSAIICLLTSLLSSQDPRRRLLLLTWVCWKKTGVGLEHATNKQRAGSFSSSLGDCYGDCYGDRRPHVGPIIQANSERQGIMDRDGPPSDHQRVES
jgi:hypothetical protein